MLQHIIRAIIRAIWGRVDRSYKNLKLSTDSAIGTLSNSVDEKLTVLQTSTDAKIQQVAAQAEADADCAFKAREQNKIELMAADAALDTKIDTLAAATGQRFDSLDQLTTDAITISRATDAELSGRIDALTGMIDDQNLDSIREIADRIKAEAADLQSLRSECHSSLTDVGNAVNAERDRAITAEAAFSVRLDYEMQQINSVRKYVDTVKRDSNSWVQGEMLRANQAEVDLSARIEAESNRAQSAEGTFAEQLSMAINDRMQSDSMLSDSINNEIQRAQQAEADLSNRINDEMQQIQQVRMEEWQQWEQQHMHMHDVVNNTFQQEQQRAQQAEADLSARIDAETQRATAAEQAMVDAFSAFLSAELQAKSASDWDSLIERMVSEEISVFAP